MEAREAIRSTKGKFFSAQFFKKDGTLRKMNARTGVRKGTVGQGLAYDPADYGLATVYDLGKRNYRFINLRTLKSVDCGKLHWRTE